MWRQREKKDRDLDGRRQLADGLGPQWRHGGEAREQLQAQAPGLAQEWAPEVAERPAQSVEELDPCHPGPATVL